MGTYNCIEVSEDDSEDRKKNDNDKNKNDKMKKQKEKDKKENERKKKEKLLMRWKEYVRIISERLEEGKCLNAEHLDKARHMGFHYWKTPKIGKKVKVPKEENAAGSDDINNTVLGSIVKKNVDGGKNIKWEVKLDDNTTRSFEDDKIGDLVNDEGIKDSVGKPLIFASDFNTNRDTTVFKQFESTMLGHNNILESAYDLNDTVHVNSLKWRRGGDQAYKCIRIDQSVDFIFYSPAHFKCRGFLSVPAKNEVISVTNDVRMPFWNYPSDHFCIGADFDLIPRATF